MECEVEMMIFFETHVYGEVVNPIKRDMLNIWKLRLSIKNGIKTSSWLHDNNAFFLVCIFVPHVNSQFWHSIYPAIVLGLPAQ